MVKKEKNSFGIIPIENSLAGSIHKNYDLLCQYPLWIIGEITLRIKFNLMGLPDAKFDFIKEIWSHPIALNQCQTFLKRSHFKLLPVYDSAGAAKLLVGKKRKDVAVITGPDVAHIYGLITLKNGLEDNSENFTRFFILSKNNLFASGEKSKTSIVFGVKNTPGILFKCLSVFALRNIDLVKLESRPIIGKPWEYMFYIDFKGSLVDVSIKQALEALKKLTNFLKILGSYETKEGNDDSADT